LVLALALASSAAGAQPSPNDAPSPARKGVHLSWVRGAGALSCSDAGHLQADVVRRLDYDPFGEPSDASIEVAVSRTDSAWKAEIEMRTPTGESLGSRMVTSEAPLCASLASAAGLAVALMIDPDAMTRVQPTKTREPPPKPVATVAPLPTSPPPRSERGLLSVDPVVALGILPSLAVGVRLQAKHVIGNRAHLLVSGVFLPEQRQEGASGRVNFGLSWATIGLCHHFPARSDLALATCASMLFGALHSVVLDPIPLEPGQRFWWAGSIGLQLQWTPWPSVGLHVGADVVAPWNRRNYVIERTATAPATSVFEQPAVGALGGAGVHVSF